MNERDKRKSDNSDSDGGGSQSGRDGWRSRSPHAQNSRCRSPARRRYERHDSSPDYSATERRVRREPSRERRNMKPSRTVIMRNLAKHVDENILWLRLTSDNVNPVDVRLIRRTDPADTRRNYAYVEFKEVADAERWMQSNKSEYDVDERCRAWMEYERERTVELDEKGQPVSGDWICDKCAALNFSRRDRCYKCGRYKARGVGDARLAGDYAVGHVQCDTDQMNAAAAVAQNAMERERRRRQQQNQREPDVRVNLLNNSIAYPSSGGVAAYQPSVPPPSLHGVAGAASAANPAMALLMQQQRQSLAALQAVSAVFSHQTATAPVAATAAQINYANTVQTPHGLLPIYPEPDMTTYQFEESSGYYFDPSTGLYYDPQSRYYFNADLQKWLYWDSNYKTFLPCPDASSASTASATAVSDDKPKSAQNIAKEMEDWAKKSNKEKKKEAKPVSMAFQKTLPKRSAAGSSDPSAIGTEAKAKTADMAFALLERCKGNLASLTADEGESTSTSVAEPAADIHVDFAALTCLLCRRKFPNEQVLMKHVNFSELHKKNVVALSSSIDEVAEDDSSLAQTLMYRDRAKERRDKYGVDDSTRTVPLTAPPKKPANGSAAGTPWVDTITLTTYEQPTAHGIGADNIGNKLLKNMGWQEGSGLGRTGQGIVAPIEAHMRQKGVGLGAIGAVRTGPAAIGEKPSSSDYRAAAQLITRERYEQAQ